MAEAEPNFWMMQRRKQEEKKKRGAPRSPSLVKLQKTAARAVKKQSKELVDVLMKDALKGDVSSTRMLVSLTEGEAMQEKPKRKRRGLSEAQRLAMEPEWKGPVGG